jgi:O-antigen/teichoic acid export membrane protein
VLLAARAAFVLALGAAANIALANLLTPREFGVMALGTTLLLLGTALAEGGLGVALIRGEAAPRDRELTAVNGLQIAATVAVAAISAAIGAPFGEDGLVVAAMAATLPITVLRAPSVIVLERSLRFREIATADVAESVVFYLAALAAVSAGMGLWGVVLATALRALVGTAVMAHLGPVGLVRPRWSWPDVRPLVRFGVQLQMVGIASLVREQLLNAAIAIVAGIEAVGVWSLALRILRVPAALFATVGRVSYPALARVLEAGSDARHMLERGVAVMALVNGAMLVGVVGLAPAVPLLVGPGWGEVPPTLLWASVALILNAPIWVMATSYFFAVGDPHTALQALAVHTVVWFGLCLPFVDSVGVEVVGLAWIAAALAAGVVLVRRTFQRSGARLVASMTAPASAALAATATAWTIGSAGPPTLLCGVAGAVAGELVLLAGLMLLRPALLRDARALIAESVGGRRTVRA